MTPTSTARRRRSRLVLGALVPASLLAGGCDARSAYESSLSLGFPKPVTEQAQRIYDLWLGSVAAAAVVGLFVTGLILFAVLRYRRRSDQLPAQIRYNLPIEVLYTVVPFVIIAVLFYYTTITQNFVNELTPKSDPTSSDVVEIGVVGFQWNWTFVYQKDQVQTTGDQRNRPELVLPVGKKIRFTETSPDVIHSFFVPAFLFKRDVIPGRANTFEVTITKQGEYVGRCAELCGEKHSAMNFLVRVVSPEQYRAYVDQLKLDPANAVSQTPVSQGAVPTDRQAADGTQGDAS